MNYNLDDHDRLVDKYLDTIPHCPKCNAEIEIDTSGSNERDSSGDRHYCPKCGWECSEMAVWAAEERARERDKKK